MPHKDRVIGQEVSRTGRRDLLRSFGDILCKIPFKKQGSFGLLLVAISFVAFFPVFKQPFIFYDDPDYVTGNAHVRRGLDLAGLRWAFSSIDACNWHPLTWISHMVDCQLFGLEAGGHHFTNVLIHAANALLVFFVLARATRNSARSLVVALLFAVHPLHVESVAWISERKDVLSTFFFLITLWSYTRYSECRTLGSRISPGSKTGGQSGRAGLGATGWYCLTAAFFGLSLLSKPMAVTAPFVMLLFDFWPLKRLAFSPTRQTAVDSKWRILRKLLIEKIPFIAMSLCVCCVTLIAQKKAIAGHLPLSFRLCNAVVSYCAYVGKFLWPARLSIFYPWEARSFEAISLAAVGIIAVSLIALWRGRNRRYFPVGWFWFLGTLIPVIGLVQVGSQSMADRYMYIPSIGLSIVLVWGIGDFWRYRGYNTTILSAAAALLVIVCLSATERQLRYWTDTEKLFRHALSITGPTANSLTCLGLFLKDQHRLDEATDMLDQAIELVPTHVLARSGLGGVLFEKGKYDEAYVQYSAWHALDPSDPGALTSLACVFIEKGDFDAAINNCREALRIDPNHGLGHYNLATALWKSGHSRDALAEYQTAIDLIPYYAPAYTGYGLALTKLGQLDRAVAQFQSALKLDAESPNAHQGLATVLTLMGNIEGALHHYRAAVRAKPDFVEARCNLAELLVSDNRLGEAAAEFRKAIATRSTYALAHSGLGTLLLKQGEIEGALKELSVALTLDPGNSSLHCTVGHLLAQQGYLEDAISHYEQAVKLSPDSANSHYFLGGALTEKGDLDAALNEFKEALRIQPDNLQALADMGRVLESQGHSKEAIAYLQRVVAIDPGNADVHSDLGVALFKAGQREQALAQFRETLRLKPGHEMAQRNLAAIEQAQAPKTGP